MNQETKQKFEFRKKLFQASFLIMMLVLQQLMVFTPLTAFAQAATTTPNNQSGTTYSGPEQSIRDYLKGCIPSEPVDSKNSTTQSAAGATQTSAQSTAASNNAKDDLYNCIQTLFRFAFVAAGISAIFMFVWAGYMYMFDSGDGNRKAKGKTLMMDVIIGIVLLGCTYIFLRFINPNILTYRTFQQANITGGDHPDQIFGGGTVRDPSGASITGDGSGPANHAASELAGCSFQGNKANYVKYLTENMFQATKSICATVSAKGLKPQISSISTGSHAENSLHYKGCAVDFAGGDSNYVNTPTGQAVIAAAKAAGISANRINPGTDASQTFHVHVDVGTNLCTAPVLPDSATQ